MSLIAVEVEIDDGVLTAREPHRLPKHGVGLLTVLTPEEPLDGHRRRVFLPLVHCVPGTVVNPTVEDLDDSLWN